MTKFIGYTVAIVLAAIAFMYFVFPALILMGVSALFLGLLALPFLKWIAGFLAGVAVYQLGKKAFRWIASQKSAAPARAVQAPDFARRKVNEKEVEFMFSKEM